MTMKQISRLNYIVGRIEGIASGTEGDVQSALLDTAENLAELLAEIEQKDKPFDEQELIQKAKQLGLSAERIVPDGKGGWCNVPADF